MCFPIAVHFVDRLRKRLVRITDHQYGFRLRTIRMQIVTMTKAVCIVKTENRAPKTVVLNLQLNREFNDNPRVPLLPTPHANLVRQQLVNPLALNET